MAGARSFARALLCMTGAQLSAVQGLGFSLLGQDVACRSSLNPAEICQERPENRSACRGTFDLLTQVTFDECQTVCQTLAASCTGFTFSEGAPASAQARSCEVWKVPIRALAPGPGKRCYMRAGLPANGTRDGTFVLQFTLRVPFLNFAEVARNRSTFELLQAAVAQGVAGGYADSVEPSLVRGVTASRVSVSADFIYQTLHVTVTVPAGGSALVMRAVLREPSVNASEDGTVSILPNLTEQVRERIQGMGEGRPGLLSGNVSVSLRSQDRHLTGFAAEPAPPPTPAPLPPANPDLLEENYAKADTRPVSGASRAAATVVAAMTAIAVALARQPY